VPVTADAGWRYGAPWSVHVDQLWSNRIPWIRRVTTPKVPEPSAKAFNLAEAKARLSWLVRRAEKGEVILIKRYGRVVGKLVPAEAPPRPKRTPGAWKGRVRIAPDFDEVDTGIARLMEEEPVEPPA